MNTTALLARINRAAGAAVTAGGVALKSAIQVELGATQGSEEVHAAPGAVPDRQTGDLQEKISVAVSGNTATVSATSDHAVALEYGSSTVDARPFMRPAVATSSKQVISAMKAAFRGALK